MSPIVTITTPGSATLSRAVVASGNVGPQDYACRAVGWYVISASGWTGYFIKTDVTPASDGAFTTGVLEMGADAETTSSWYPFVLGGTAAGCAWLGQLWAQTPTGEYHGAWPPAGLTPLYSAPSPIHRAS